MKAIIAFLLLLFSQPGFADLQRCSIAAIGDKMTKKAVEFLQSIQGRYQLGRCRIELTVCSSNPAPIEGDDMVVGDISITDPYGRPFYFVFDMNQADTDRVKKLILNGSRMVHYEDLEHLYGPTTGRSENYRLEIVKTPDLKQIESLDLGIYTSKLRREDPHLNPGKSYWVNCANH